MKAINYQKVSLKVLNDLPERQKQVLIRRFGLETGEKETLEKIGESFGVTRERIRQIEADGFDKLQRKKEDREVKKAFGALEEYLKEKGGLKRQDVMLSDVSGDGSENHVNFVLSLGDNFYSASENNHHFSFWGVEKGLSNKVKGISKELEKEFKKIGKPLSEEEFNKFAKDISHPTETFLSSVETLKRIGRGPLRHYGLIDWPEIKPNGVKDRAYLALKREGKPMHFREIAEKSKDLEGEFCDRKEVLPQTVHNELIRDDRFVLVGRGLYALTEWDYDRGTVKEIVAKILKNSSRPLSREEVVERTKEQRLVKDSTILLNLNDKEYFAKDENNRYTLKKEPKEV